MAKFITIEDALRSAVLTAQGQPRHVPEAPAGWLERATAALDAEDESQISVEAHAITRAHALYRAGPDVMGWLYDLRMAVREARGDAKEKAGLPRRPEVVKFQGEIDASH